MLIIMREMRENREKERAVRSPYSLLRIIACMLVGADRERERGERAQSRSDAIVVPQHFLSTATVFVCLVSMETANT